MRVVPGLDGLRGVAVLAVMAFHAGLAWARRTPRSRRVLRPVGLLDHVATRRRARSDRHHRPAPILGPTGPPVAARPAWSSSPGSVLYATLVARHPAPEQLRGDALSTLVYVANWHYILAGQNYFVRFGAPSPLLHTWSLAVEEQFYLVWPLVAALGAEALGAPGARLGRRDPGGRLGRRSAPPVPGRDLRSIASTTAPTRGAQTIMVGAALAVLVPPFSAAPVAREPAIRRERAGQSAGCWATGGCWPRAVFWPRPFSGGVCTPSTARTASLYEGGFLVVGVATAVVITLIVRRPADPLSRALSWRPLRYAGRISYGLYLYHWPIFLMLDSSRTG